MFASGQLAMRMDVDPNTRDKNPYLPLTDKSAAQFLNDFEGFVLACIRRMSSKEAAPA